MGAKTSEHLELLYQLSQSFNSSLELDQVLNTVIDEVIVATNAERGFIILIDEEGQYQFPVARGMELEIIKDPAGEVSHGVVDKVLSERESVMTTDALTDKEFEHRKSVQDLGIRSIISVPLIIQDRLLGAIYIDNRFQKGIFTDKERDLLIAIASSASIAIENARLYQVAVDKGRMERELQLAREVQESHIPDEIPDVEGWELATRWLPAREVAGDFFDFIERHQRLGVVIADVVDKGMPSALFMASSRSVIRANVRYGVAPDDIVTVANRVICSDTTSGMFLSLIYAELQVGSGGLSYVNAGHPLPLLYKNETDKVEELAGAGFLVGLDVESRFESQSLTIEPGDFLLLYTDGVTDITNDQDELYGTDRFLNFVQNMDHHKPADEVLTSIEAELKEFSGSKPPYDDITLVMIRRV
jgi:serine phosphatase RsbU (regulator of sigma subunit)